jgi:hypothetical protein
MDFFTTVPLLWGRPINVWLGIILGILLIWQVCLGMMMVKGKMQYLKMHKINATLIIIIAFVHAYYGLGIWFFNFQIK